MKGAANTKIKIAPHVPYAIAPNWRGVIHPSLDQLPHGKMAVDEELGAAGQVGEKRLGEVEAEVLVEGGEDFAELDGAFDGFAA